MRMRTYLGLILLATASAPAEVIDRVAVTVDGIVITESDLISHIRIAAFLNREPLAITPEIKRDAARRLVEQALVRREMQISRYPGPSESDVDAMLKQALSERPEGERGTEVLAKYGITEQELRDAIRLQLTMLRFIEYRFRAGEAISDEEIERYYREQFVPQASPAGPPPPIEDVREDIEEAVAQERVNEALDDWLNQAAEQARIRYREEALQ